MKDFEMRYVGSHVEVYSGSGAFLFSADTVREAMEELAELEKKRRAYPAGVASDEMCTFLILNISSLQLIPVNIIAYRSQYGSVNPTLIVGPAIVATMVSTAVAVVFCRIMQKSYCKNK